MQNKKIILFYKNISSVGGAEVLLCKHYNYLIDLGFDVKIVCFKFSEIDRLNINKEDIEDIKSSSFIFSMVRLIKILLKIKPTHSFCHSGYLNFGFAALITNSPYSTFVHHPTTMSFNETDKLSFFYFNKYKKFAKKDHMYKKIVQLKKNYSLAKMIYINLRAPISQLLLRRSKKIFVLSNYAVEEKKKIFNIKSQFECGAIANNKLKSYLQPEPYTVNKTLNFVTLSRLDKNKRIDLIIRSMKHLKNHGYNFSLKIGGTGPDADNLKSIVKDEGLSKHVDFLGYVPESEIKSLYKNMDLFITIDWADFRITTYEILKYNKKIIVSDDTEIDNFLLNSGYLLYSESNAESLFKNITKHINSSILCSNHSLEDYLENFTWNNYFKSINKHVGISI